MSPRIDRHRPLGNSPDRASLLEVAAPLSRRILPAVFRVLPVLIACLGLGIPAQSAAEPLTTAAAIRALPREVADQKLPAVVQGVVTFVRKTDLVIADATAGIYVSFVKANAEVQNLGRISDVQLGMRLEVTGTTAPGGFAPTIRASALRYLGIGELPPPSRWATASSVPAGLIASAWNSAAWCSETARSSPRKEKCGWKWPCRAGH